MHRPTEPRCIVIAGPNGAGKTTFAREYLPKVVGLVQFVNADLIARASRPSTLRWLRLRLAAFSSGKPIGSRFDRGWEHFVKVYRPLADEWAAYDNSGKSPRLIERWP